MAKSPEEGMATLLKNLLEKTGKPIDEWVAIARSTGLKTHKPIVAYLKTDHSLPHGYANQIALRAIAPETTPETSSDDPIDTLYSGPKAHLRPIHDALIAHLQTFGTDIEVSPKKATLASEAPSNSG